MAEKLPEVVVVGDALLDEYHFVETSGTEQDAPVTRSARTEYAPGGAANVAANLTGLGIRTLLVAPLGDDDAGRRLDQLCVRVGLSAVGTYGNEDGDSWTTPVKTRYVERQTWRQLLRVDREVGLDALTGEAAGLAGWHERAEAAVDGLLYQRIKAEAVAPVLVFSDYGKGACNEWLVDALMGRVLDDKIPVFVDTPRGGVESFRLYASPHTTFKLNMEQALRCVYGPWVSQRQPRSAKNRHDAADADNDLAWRLHCWLKTEDIDYRYLVMTCGERGMILVESAPSGRCTVEDGNVLSWSYPVGAGDTATAILAAAVARKGYDWYKMEAALYLANAGAAVAAAKPGTHRLLLKELSAAVGGKDVFDE